MRELEISTAPRLDEPRQRLVDLHSLLNVLNIISLQLVELELDFPQFRSGIVVLADEIQELSRGFCREDDILPLVDRLRAMEGRIVDQLDFMSERPESADCRPILMAAVENVTSIFSILNVRLDEFVYRADQPDVWIEIGAEVLIRQMQDVLGAIEKNAGGRYRIHYDRTLQGEGDYYVDLRVETHRGDRTIWMPLRLKDILRDLLANARKYTKPGGRVALSVHQSEERIQCVIEDSGCGIPEDELEKVSEFGYRASNVRDRRTMGGGFGLTKAVWLVLSWGGQFRISSGPGEGTRIQIDLSNKPAHLQARKIQD